MSVSAAWPVLGFGFDVSPLKITAFVELSGSLCRSATLAYGFEGSWDLI